MSAEFDDLCADVVDVLERRVERGNTYVKAALVASRVSGLNSKQASLALRRLEERGIVDRWTENSTAITWEINADAFGGDGDA